MCWNNCNNVILNFPDRVSARGSSNSGGWYHLPIFITSRHHTIHIVSSSSPFHHFHMYKLHVLTFTSCDLHMCTCRLLIFASSLYSRLHISSSHFHISTSSHVGILSCWHPLRFTSTNFIFTSSYFLIFSFSHLHIFTFAHLPIFLFAQFHISTSSNLPISFTQSHICTSNARISRVL